MTKQREIKELLELLKMNMIHREKIFKKEFGSMCLTQYDMAYAGIITNKESDLITNFIYSKEPLRAKIRWMCFKDPYWWRK